MKRLLTIFVIITLVFMFHVAVPTNVSAKSDTAAAGILSMIMPGAGEWYNDGYKRPFPWSECIVGYICFCVMFSSVVDAATGDTTEDIRADFWTIPTQ